jgi:RHS repeat-associated protein
VACQDTASGTGYILYSAESVFTRFIAHPPEANNAVHFICVKYESSLWKYDDNTAYYVFEPADSDILVAAVDFTNDTVASLVGQNTVENGIVKGYSSGNLTFTADWYNGASNDGEFGLGGSSFTPNYPAVYPTPFTYGVACQDSASGSGYLLYSAEDVCFAAEQQICRFAAHPPEANNARHFIAVRYNAGTSQWEYDNNTAYYAFSPAESDVLVATLNFDTDTAALLNGTNSSEYGIAKGYRSGDLAVAGDTYNGNSNDGEFYMTGAYFVPNSRVLARKVYNGIAMRENGTLYWLFTDHLGSTSIMADAAGNKVSELRFKPWGEVRFGQGRTPTGIRYTGQRSAPELGLHFFKARWYDSYLNRWTSPDGIIPDPYNPINWDRYAYTAFLKSENDG